MSVTNKEIVQQVNDAFLTNNIEVFLDHCTDEISWTMVGKPALEGKDAIRAFMGNMEGMDPPKLTLINTIAEGDLVASEGYMEMKNSDGSPYKGAFCDVYQFRDGKIIALKSYIVDLAN